MSDHLKLSGRPFELQRDALLSMIRDEPVLMEVLAGIADLPEGLLVAGALYNLAWNRLTGRPGLAEVADIAEGHDMHGPDGYVTWAAKLLDRIS